MPIVETFDTELTKMPNISKSAKSWELPETTMTMAGSDEIKEETPEKENALIKILFKK